MSSSLNDQRRMQKFITPDKPPRKRLKAAFLFLQHSSTTHAMVKTFWIEYSSIVFSLLKEIILDLEQLYLPHQSAFGKIKKKSFDKEDWVEMFQMLEFLIRNYSYSVTTLAQTEILDGFFRKFLLKDNNYYIRMKAYQCLLIYIDGKKVKISDGELHNITDPTIDILRNAVDFQPFDGPNVKLPPRKDNEYIEGWRRGDSLRIEEPVEMMKYFLEFCIEEPISTAVSTQNSGAFTPVVNPKSGDFSPERFRYWCQLLIRIYIPILYPKIARTLKLKAENDIIGFFHHCPGYFQKIFSDWFNACKKSKQCMDILWSSSKTIDIIFDILKQRFYYPEKELIFDAIKTYSDWIFGKGYIPRAMENQKQEMYQVIIDHIQGLHTSESQFDEASFTELSFDSLNLVNLIAQQQLNVKSFSHLRNVMIQMIRMLGQNPKYNSKVSEKIMQVTFHVWIFGVWNENGQSVSVWSELGMALEEVIHLSLKTNKMMTRDLIFRWRSEMLEVSLILMKALESSGEESSELINKTTSEDVDQSASHKPSTYEKMSKSFTSDTALIVFDRMIHFLKPNYIQTLDPKLQHMCLQALSEVIFLWLDVGIAPESKIISDYSQKRKDKSQRKALPDSSHSSITTRIAPATILSLFGPWIFPFCTASQVEFQESRAIAVEILCRICTTKCEARLMPTHIVQLCHVVLSGLQSKQPMVICAILSYGVEFFSMDIPGMGILIPLFVKMIQILTKSKNINNLTRKDANSIVNILLSLISYPIRYPGTYMSSWNQQLDICLQDSELEMQEKETLKKYAHDIPSIDKLSCVIGDVMTKLLATLKDHLDLKIKCLWGLYVSMIVQFSQVNEEFVDESSMGGDKALDIEDKIKNNTQLSLVEFWGYALCRELRSNDERSHTCVLEIFITLSDSCDLLIQRGKLKLVQGIILSCCRYICKHVDDIHQSIKSIAVMDQSKHESSSSSSMKMLSKSLRISTCFDCIRRWMMQDECKHILYTDNIISKNIFQALEAALVGKLPLQEDLQQMFSSLFKIPSQEKSLFKQGIELQYMLNRDNQSELSKRLILLGEAAENLILHLLHHFHNFPSVAGPSQMDSKCTEFIDMNQEPHVFSFVYLNSMIISLVGSLNSSHVRMILRDAAGTFTWDAGIVKPITENKTSKPSSLSYFSSSSIELSSDSILETNTNKTLNSSIGVRWIPNEVNGQKTIQVVNVKDIEVNDCEQINFHESRNHGLSNKIEEEKDDVIEEKNEDDNTMDNKDDDESVQTSNNSTGSSDSNSIDFDHLWKSNIIPLGLIGGILDMNSELVGVGFLPQEECLFNLFIDGIGMRFNDCNFNMSDKTLFGGKYVLNKYAEMDKIKEKDYLCEEKKDMEFFERLIYDDESFHYLRKFLATRDAKNIGDFCFAVKAYRQCYNKEDRLSQICAMYWDFFIPEGRRYIEFPSTIAYQFQVDLKEQIDFKKDYFDTHLSLVEQIFQNQHKNDFLNLHDIPLQLRHFHEYEKMEKYCIDYETTLQDYEAHQLAYASVFPCIKATPDKEMPCYYPFDLCRLFLSQFHFLPNHSQKIYLLENNPKVIRSLKHLDQSHTREVMKIGVVYVGPGQKTQIEIFGNSSGSKEYEDFLLGLGWKIDLKLHHGFLGGLDCKSKTLSNGSHTIYYADSSSEVIYHVITQMPTKPGDPQQIDKKKHVGNDFVHIVWSDNHRDFVPNTITSNFNEVQIVIYPHNNCSSNGLFRIQVHSKEGIDLFGPLFSGMVICKKDLAKLVRQTAMNATRCCRRKTPGFKPAYSYRRDLIDEIQTRYGEKAPTESLLNNLFRASSPNSNTIHSDQ